MADSRQLNKIYVSRINKCFDYIEANLDKQFSLEELADVANFSKFHFNRIFYAMVGETPFKFINRIRMEKAALLLVSKENTSISEIALRCGYSDMSVFSRSFSKYMNISPSKYRKQKSENSNICQKDSNINPLRQRDSFYISSDLQTLNNTNMELNKSMEVKELPAMTLAYIRHIGPYEGDEKLFENIWNRLFAWAGPRGLIGGKDFRSLVIYHDDPHVTDDDKLRMSVCITVPPDTKVDGEVGKMKLEKANYAIGRFEVTANDFEKAWSWMYSEWLPTSGYQPDDKPCFEMYPEEPKDNKFIVDICIPVKPA